MERVVYLDTPFSSKYGGAHPIIYALSDSISRNLKLQPEGVVRHRQILRYLRAKISGLNFVTKEHVPVSYIEFAIVDQEDANKVSKFLIENDFNLSVIPMESLADGKNSDFSLELVIEGSKELLRQSSLS